MFPLACAAIASAALPEKTRHQIELFADLAPGDSIAAVRATSADTLELEVVPAGRGPRRITRHFVPPTTLDKILAHAQASNRGAAQAQQVRGGESERPRIREDYMGAQLAASTYVYSVGLVSALGLQNEAVILVPAFAVAGSLAAHAVFSLNHPLSEAQVVGMNYAAGSAIISSYALPFLALGQRTIAFRFGSAISLAAYPSSLVAGYRYGANFEDRPGDLSKKAAAAGIFAGTGAVLPWVFLGPEDNDLRWRLSAGSILVLGTAGHYAADLYRPGETLTAGVTTGIGTHIILGTMAGFALASGTDNPRLETGLVLGSALFGFGEGLAFFRHRNDDEDQANYSGLGMAAGVMLAGAVALATDASASGALWGMTLSGFTGYAFTYSIMESRRAARTRRADAGLRGDEFVKGVSFALAPVPEQVRRAPGERFDRFSGGRAEMRYKVPGVIVRF